MSRRRFWTLISVAIGLMVTAIALPFLMVLRVIAPNVALSFLSYAMSVGGLGISLYTIVVHSAGELRRRRREEQGHRNEG